MMTYNFAEVWHDHTFHTTVPGTRARGHVGGLRPAVTYQFRIYADNELGRSQASDVGIVGQVGHLHLFKSHIRRPSLRSTLRLVLAHPEN